MKAHIRITGSGRNVRVPEDEFQNGLEIWRQRIVNEFLKSHLGDFKS